MKNRFKEFPKKGGKRKGRHKKGERERQRERESVIAKLTIKVKSRAFLMATPFQHASPIKQQRNNKQQQHDRFTVDAVIHHKSTHVQDPLSLCMVTAFVVVRQSNCPISMAQDCSCIAHISRVQDALFFF